MKALIQILLLSICWKGIAQTPPGLAWKKVYGGKKSEKAFGITATYDGKIAVIGSSTTEPAQKTDALFLLLDANGQQQKSTLLGGSGDDILRAIAPTYDGGYILAGQTNSFGAGKEDGWLVKLDEKGDTLWQKTAGYHRKEFFNDIIQTADGSLVAVGAIERSEGKTDMWVYKMYPDGPMKWQQFFGSKGTDEARAVAEDAAGNIAIAGITAQGKGGRNIWLFIVDKEGKPLYHQIFGSREYEDVSRIVATRDGGFALAGFAKAGVDGNGLKDMWLIKTAPNGEMVWQNTFGGRSNDSAFGMTETTDGGLILVGYTFSHLIGANTSNALIVKVDGKGKLVWQEDGLGGKQDDELTASALLPDGGFVFAGTTSSKSENADGQDIWVVRYNREFDVNTAIPTNLSLEHFELKDNGDNVLEEGEQAFLTLKIENTGRQDAYDIDLVLQEKTNAKELVFRNYQKIGFLPAGQSKQVFIPLKCLEGVKPGDAVLEAFCTDASRSRTPPVELSVPLKPLNLPSDYLDVQWLDPAPVKGIMQAEVKTGKYTIRLRTRSDRKLNRSHFTVLLNGEPYKVGAKAGETDLADKGKARDIFIYEYTNQLDLKAGKNTVQVVIQNGDKKATSPAFELEYSDKPNLHILAIGIEHDDLKFTTKDAKDFANSFKGQDGLLYDKVYLTTLVSGTRTPAGVFQTEGDVIKKAFRDLKEKYNYTIYEQDLMVVFLSSHGKTVNKDFKIIPTDFGLAGEKVLVDYQNDIIEQLNPLPCRKIVFIDACHSGSFENATTASNTGFSEAGNARSATLIALSSADQNTYTLASCRAEESSWEDEKWGNGAFTKAIIGAFQNEKFKDAEGEFSPAEKDGILTIGELYHYIGRRVPQMLLAAGKQGSQHPYISQEQLDKVKGIAVFEVK
ncbi:MAG: caspase family protein [Saprospiraceae bacterium]